MDIYEINELACECRNDWNIDITGPINVLQTVLNKNTDLTIVFLDMDENISGACYKFDFQSIIFVNSTHTKARQFFSIAHEMYHLLYDDNDFNICDVNSDDDIEKSADYFASSLIMPFVALNNYKKYNSIKKWNLDLIIDCEQYFQIPHDELLYRLKLNNEISEEEYEKFINNVAVNAKMRGYDLNLYRPFIDVNYTLGNYSRLVNRVYNKKLISRGKMEEFLLEAYLGDLIFNIPLEEL